MGLADRLYSAVGFVRIRHLKNMPQWSNAFPLSMAGPLGLEFAFLMPHIILLPVTFWLAEIVTRFVEILLLSLRRICTGGWRVDLPRLDQRLRCRCRYGLGFGFGRHLVMGASLIVG